MEPTGEGGGGGGLGILSLVSSSLGFMKIEDDLVEVVLDQYVLPKVKRIQKPSALTNR